MSRAATDHAHAGALPAQFCATCALARNLAGVAQVLAFAAAKLYRWSAELDGTLDRAAR